MFVKFNKQQKDMMISEIQRFFHEERNEERNEEIGLIAAESAFEFIKNHLGPHFYNEAIKDARQMVEQKMNSLEEDLYSLVKNLK